METYKKEWSDRTGEGERGHRLVLVLNGDFEGEATSMGQKDEGEIEEGSSSARGWGPFSFVPISTTSF
jgi:hypothetical protein